MSDGVNTLETVRKLIAKLYDESPTRVTTEPLTSVLQSIINYEVALKEAQWGYGVDIQKRGE